MEDLIIHVLAQFRAQGVDVAEIKISANGFDRLATELSNKLMYADYSGGSPNQIKFAGPTKWTIIKKDEA